MELKGKATVYVSSAEKATITATGNTTTVDVVETPCDMTVNTAGGNDAIRVGVVYETAQQGISGTNTTEGWLSAGAKHTLTLNTGSGDDRVDLHSVQGKVLFSGGTENDTLYIQQYRYDGRHDKYPIGEFGAYQDVETVVLNRLVDRYLVVEGDDLSTIAQEFGVTVDDLVKWNGEQIKDPNLILIGQELIVGPYRTEEEIITDRIG